MKQGSKIYKKNGLRRVFALLMTAALTICGSNLTVLAEEDGGNGKLCICERKCSEAETNEECPVCAENYNDCIYQDSAEPGEVGGEISDQEDDQDAVAGENASVSEGGDESAWDGVNEDDANENENTGDGVNESDNTEGVVNNSIVEEAEGEVWEDEGIETYVDFGDSFEDGNGVIYRAINDSQAEVLGHRDGEAVSGGIVIPEEIEYDGSRYRVTRIAVHAFRGCSGLTDFEMPDSLISIGVGAFEKCSSLHSVEIPDGVTRIENFTFSECSSLTSVGMPNGITDIGRDAFGMCSSLTSIEMPDGLISIGSQAFMQCSSLTSIEIPDGVTDIGGGAFLGCRGLASVKIPNGITRIAPDVFSVCENLTSVELPDSITHIETHAFSSCRRLVNIKMPDSLISIGSQAFFNCISLPSVNIPKSVRSIGEEAFWRCTKLNVLQVTVSSDGVIEVPTVDVNAFQQTPSDRMLVFYGEDGTLLTGSALEAAQEAYRADKGSEGGNNFWWGWRISDTDLPPVRTIKINVNKDNSEWADHTKQFGLKQAGNPDAALITDLTSAVDGEYRIFDITDMDSIMDTGVDITVNGSAAEAAVDYYTVTFYDGDSAYADGTLQAPQIILKGEKAVQPADPSKPGFRFRQWTTMNNGREAFNFDLPIAQRSNVYADWGEETAAEYIITASAGEGGGIFPEGNVRVAEGGAQTFEITPNEGYRIKSVVADGMDVTEKLADSALAGAVRAQAGTSRYYTFSDVREEHTIEVAFEKEIGGDGGFTGGGGNGSDDHIGFTGGRDNGTSDGESSGGSGMTGGDSNSENKITEEENSGNAGNTDNAGNTGNPVGNTEPKTGDQFQVEIYATVAMIAGLAYLMLHFMDNESGMTEDEKQELLMRMIGWARRGSRLRRYAVLVPIFILLAYYHSIGKRIYVERWL